MKQDPELKTTVSEILRVVQQVAPGKSVELRIPGYAAIQCVKGQVHKRGTPPNAIEMSAKTLVDLVGNPDLWESYASNGAILASGSNSNLMKLFIQVGKVLAIDK
jgi:hypothetical protein